VRFKDWLVDHDIDPHIPVRDKSKRKDGTFSRDNPQRSPGTGLHQDGQSQVFGRGHNDRMYTHTHEGMGSLPGGL